MDITTAEAHTRDPETIEVQLEIVEVTIVEVAIIAVVVIHVEAVSVDDRYFSANINFFKKTSSEGSVSTPSLCLVPHIGSG